MALFNLKKSNQQTKVVLYKGKMNSPSVNEIALKEVIAVKEMVLKEEEKIETKKIKVAEVIEQNISEEKEEK